MYKRPWALTQDTYGTIHIDSDVSHFCRNYSKGSGSGLKGGRRVSSGRGREISDKPEAEPSISANSLNNASSNESNVDSDVMAKHAVELAKEEAEQQTEEQGKRDGEGIYTIILKLTRGEEVGTL